MSQIDNELKYNLLVGLISTFLIAACHPRPLLTSKHVSIDASNNGVDKVLINNDTFYLLHDKASDFLHFVNNDTTSYPQIKMLKTIDDRQLIYNVPPDNLHLLVKHVPQDLHFKICIDQDGEPTAITLLQKNIDINYEELDHTIHQLFNLRFEKKPSAPKYECIHKIYQLLKN